MPLKASAADLENAVADYLAGESCQVSAARHHTSQQTLKGILVERGLWRSRAESQAIGRSKGDATVMARLPLSVPELVERYRAGESVNALAKSFGVSRSVISRRLTDAGVELRGVSSANQLMMSQRTPEENAAYVAAAHSATRGVSPSLERKVKSAITREARQIGVSVTERRLAEMLSARGVDVTPQKAVGPYNVDIATGTIAVEIFGGGWHAHGRHRERSAERCRYLLDQGWNLVIIWVSPARWPLTSAAADYIVSLAEMARVDPTIRGQYRVIWGDGKEASTVDLDINDLSAKPSRSGRKRPRTLDHGTSD